jgi:hypothetical protein
VQAQVNERLYAPIVEIPNQPQDNGKDEDFMHVNIGDDLHGD